MPYILYIVFNIDIDTYRIIDINMNIDTHYSDLRFMYNCDVRILNWKNCMQTGLRLLR